MDVYEYHLRLDDHRMDFYEYHLPLDDRSTDVIVRDAWALSAPALLYENHLRVI